MKIKEQKDYEPIRVNGKYACVSIEDLKQLRNIEKLYEGKLKNAPDEVTITTYGLKPDKDGEYICDETTKDKNTKVNELDIFIMPISRDVD